MVYIACVGTFFRSDITYAVRGARGGWHLPRSLRKCRYLR